MANGPYRILFFILTYCSLSYSYFGFKGGTLVLIASVLGHCLLFTLDRFNLVEFVLHVNIKQVEICVYSTFVTNDFLKI